MPAACTPWGHPSQPQQSSSTSSLCGGRELQTQPFPPPLAHPSTPRSWHRADVWLLTPPSGQLSVRLFAVSEEKKKQSRVIPATQDSGTGHQHPAEAQVTIVHYTRDLLPTAPSVPTEGRLHRGTVKLSYGMTPSTQGIKGDFLFTPAIFTSQKRVLGEQPSPEALLRAEIPTPSSLQPAGCSPAGDDSPALLAAQG